MARKIEKLTYINERGESIEFSHASTYHTNQVSGLSDVRNAIYSINSMGQDGDTYLGQRIESRDIEIVGSINERSKDRALSMRRNLNRILNPELAATLTYEYGGYKRVIDCKVDNAPIITRGVIFLEFTLQFRCLNPFWRKDMLNRVDIASWIGGFEFPEPLGLEIVPSDTTWEIGYRQPTLIVNVHNEGDVKAGLKVEFRAMGEVANPMILNVHTREFIKINFEMERGDILTVSTGYGEKDVQLNRSGEILDAFRYLDPDSTYMQLEVGDNLIRYSADSNESNLEVILYHDDLYLGV